MSRRLFSFRTTLNGMNTASVCAPGQCVGATDAYSADRIDLAGGLVSLTSVSGSYDLNGLTALSSLSFGQLGEVYSLHSHFPLLPGDTAPGTKFHFSGSVPHTVIDALGIELTDTRWIDGDVTVNTLNLVPDPANPGASVSSAYTVCYRVVELLAAESACSKVGLIRVKP